MLGGCNKTKYNAHKLDGTWTIYSFSKIQPGGFTEKYDAQGTITYHTSKDGTFTYEADYWYVNNGDTVLVQRTGEGKLKGKRSTDYDLHVTLPAEQTIECAIHLLSKDDLKIHENEVTGTNIFVLQKP